MPDGLSRISSVLQARLFGREPVNRVLSVASVLEEEFNALHPGQSIPDLSYHAPYSGDDIVDLVGFARALVDSSPGNPLRAMGAVILERRPGLAEALRTPTDSMRDQLASTLNDLLGVDLTSFDAYKAVIAEITSRDEEKFAALDVRARNRLILDVAFEPFLRTCQDQRLATVYKRMHDAQHSALCLSGGGIRSASFALGVIQALGEQRDLRRFHYLSTVSGGGYTGSWLSAWMARDGAERVHDELAGADASQCETEPAAVRHIRKFSYYLTPRFSAFSADTWTLVATIARNILLIWLVTIPFLMAVLMLPRLFVAGPATTLRTWNALHIDPGVVIAVLGLIGTICIIGAFVFVQRNLYTFSGRSDETVATRPAVTLARFMTRCYAPLLTGVVLLVQQWHMLWTLLAEPSPTGSESEQLAQLNALTHQTWLHAFIRLDPDSIAVQGFAIVLGVSYWISVYFIAWLFSARGRVASRAASARAAAIAGATAGLIGALLAVALFGGIHQKHAAEFYTTFAVPSSLFAMLVGMHVAVGLSSHTMSDAEREANARLSAWLLIALVGWVAAVGITLYGPLLLVGAAIHLKQLIGVGGVSGVLASAAAASKSAGKSPSQAGASTGVMATAQKAIIAVATPLFAVVVIVLIAMLNTQVLSWACTWLPSQCRVVDAPSFADVYDANTFEMAKTSYASPFLVLGVFAALLVVAWYLSRRIDTNRFSLHAMYRERLVRTFLGASRMPGERQPNPFTGFDERDDMPLGALWPTAGAERVHAPLHIVNTTLNMVAGTDLATQDRKATSFTFTSLHAGSAAVGFRRTCDPAGLATRVYGGPDGVSLGTAMAISGAAASPNSGYHSSPAVTFLMTLFNARLGWWLGNPGPAGRTTFDSDEPKLALQPILAEMFGRTTDHSAYVYLSDGGHFENLGLYEMVRRRTRFIVLSDAGCDPGCTFDDLGGAIRKIRVDFGISIDFDGEIPIYSRMDTKKSDGRYWAVARIRYSLVDGGDVADGYLLYIKPAFYGRETYDVFNYASSQPEFPHESTGNQFFGEAQLESYRALGLFAVREMLASQDPLTREALDAWRGTSVVPTYSPLASPYSAART